MSNKNMENILKQFREIRLPVMAEQVLMMMESNELATLPIEEILERICVEELTSRKNNTSNRLKKKAKLTQKNARLEEIDYNPQRKINRDLIEQLKTNDYIVKHRNVILLGACGTGKSYLANALGNHSCEAFYSTYYCRLFEFLEECNQSQLHSGSTQEVIKKFSKFSNLIIDDFLINELTDREVSNLFRLMEYRYDNRSTIVCSQVEPSEWHSRLGNGLLADSILDRLTPHAYQLILYGDSMRNM
jgi:DNA replication protein DnaC